MRTKLNNFLFKYQFIQDTEKFKIFYIVKKKRKKINTNSIKSQLISNSFFIIK